MDYQRVSPRFYGTVAGVYGVMDRLLFKDEATNPRLALARAIPPSARSVVDLCAGTGASSLAIADMNRQLRVVGVDISEAMLAVAEREARGARIGNLELLRADATATGLPTGAFDVVTTSLSLHEFPEPLRRAAMREMRRLVAPGGRLLVMEWDRPSRDFGKRALFGLVELAEPRGFKDFLAMDWKAFLAEQGFELEAIERCAFSKVIAARPADQYPTKSSIRRSS